MNPTTCSPLPWLLFSSVAAVSAAAQDASEASNLAMFASAPHGRSASNSAAARCTMRAAAWLCA